MEQTMNRKHKGTGKKMTKTTWIMAAGLVGILLIGIAPMLEIGGEKKQPQTEQLPSANEFAAALEQRLEEVLGRIDGVGEVKVMITLKSGYTYSYAVTEKVNQDVSEEYKSDEQHKSQQKNTTEQSYVMVEDGSSPLVTALNEPEIKGVVVVCSGGGDQRVVAEVTAAVKTALDISSAKISVSKISSGIAAH